MRSEASKTAEIMVLRHQVNVLRGQVSCPRPSWADRALISALARLLPQTRRHLFVTAGTLLRWHSDLITRRGTTKRQQLGRPPRSPPLRRLMLRLAGENPDGGYRRIAGELAALGRDVGACTVWAILHRAGIDPSPRRSGPTWAEFLRSQAHGYSRLRLLPLRHRAAHQAVLLRSRRARHPQGPHSRRHRASHRRLGRPASPHSAHGPRWPCGAVHVRDPRPDTTFTSMVDAVFASEDIQIIKAPIRAPRANAIMDRWIGSLRRELLDRMLILNARHLRRVLTEYENHFNTHRPHRALPKPPTTSTPSARHNPDQDHST